MPFATWHDLYASDLQGVVAVAIVPALFLVYLARHEPSEQAAVVPTAVRFMQAYAVVFAVLTLVDPVAGGPLLRLLGVADAPLAAVEAIAFVVLGDFRVYLLIFTLASHAGSRHEARAADPLHAASDVLQLLRPRALAAAGLATLVVPAVAFGIDRGLRARMPGLPDQTLWLIYELAFVAVALVLRGWWVPARVPALAPRLHHYLRAVLAYVASYYALWAAADVAILAGIDAGWALRMVPNQLYYAFWVPFAYWRFFASS